MLPNGSLVIQTNTQEAGGIERKAIKVVKSVYALQPIIDEVVWESGPIKMRPRSTTSFEGNIGDEPGVYIIYGHINHLDHELLQRKISIDVCVFHSCSAEDNKIKLEDILNTTSPRSASRVILTQPVLWEMKITNHSLFPSTCEMLIVKRRGLEEVYKEKLEAYRSKNIFAATFLRSFSGIEKLPSYQRERIYSVLDHWPEYSHNRIQEFPAHLALNELKRNSVYKMEAYTRGLIRPFLLLVSMDPEMRLQTAHALRIDLVKKTYLGDAHHEAFHILFKKRIGIQERANYAFKEKLSPFETSCNWYQIIYRVTRNAIKGSDLYDGDFKKELKSKAKSWVSSLDCCLDPDNKHIVDMEELFVNAVIEVVIMIFKESAPEKWEQMEEEMKSSELDEIAGALKRAGFHCEHITRLMALHIVKEGNFTEPLFNVMKQWFSTKREGRGKDRARLAVPVALLGVQLTLLAVFSIISPMIAFPVAMFSANSLLYIFRDTPGKLLSPIIALTMQRVTLACHGILIKDYSPTRDSLPDLADENASVLKQILREY